MYISQLLGKKIKTSSGEIFGPVYNIEFITEKRKGKLQAPKVIYLHYGKVGFLERFTGKKMKGERIEIKNISKIGSHFISLKKS